MFNPGLTKTKASASIVITSGTRDWKRHTVYIIHISDGHTIQAGSAYTMEFIALAAALKLQTLCKNSATPQQPIQAAPVKSDANSIVSMLAGRGKR